MSLTRASRSRASRISRASTLNPSEMPVYADSLSNILEMVGQLERPKPPASSPWRTR